MRNSLDAHREIPRNATDEPINKLNRKKQISKKDQAWDRMEMGRES